MPYYKVSDSGARQLFSGDLELAFILLVAVVAFIVQMVVLIVSDVQSGPLFTWLTLLPTEIGAALIGILALSGGYKFIRSRRRTRQGRLTLVLDEFTDYWWDRLGEENLADVFTIEDQPLLITRLGVLTRTYHGLFPEDYEGQQAVIEQGKVLVDETLANLLQSRQFEREQRRRALGVEINPPAITGDEA